jgi:ribosome-binding protein aMBF1 (putative translation factor)
MANLRTARKAAKPATKRSTRPALSRVAPSSGIAAIVKTFRHNAQLTLNELAQRANVAASTISKIESGQLSPG